jgi:FlaA1/EpsC-like NDP-sugar epimerase
MRILITGGTGTIGSLVATKLLSGDHDIIIYSRDEYKQSKIGFDCRKIIGDVRDLTAINEAMKGVDVCLHTAALKHVELMEEHPYESIKTNLFGTDNVIDACKNNGAKLVFLSTDKAVYPVNVYGMCKAIAERIVNESSVRSCVIRYGNVLDSRGSIIDKFWKFIKLGKDVPLTDPKMTRFWIQQDYVADFIVRQIVDWRDDGLAIPEIKAAPVTLLVEVLQELAAKRYNVKAGGMWKIGLRRGEKMHECLYHQHEELNSSEFHNRDEVHSNDKEYQYTKEELLEVVTAQMRGKK